jgi:hypothetical protein
VCPKGWPVKPDFVTIGDKAWRAPANPNAWIVNLTPRTNGFCPHRGNAATCEQWLPCALKWRVAVKAWGPPGPGSFNGDDAERRSRRCEAWEPDAGKVECVNNNLLTFVVGEDGSPVGSYEVCAAPTVGQIKGDGGACRSFEFSAP